MASVRHCSCTRSCIDYVCACVHPSAWQMCAWLLCNELIGHSCICLDLEYSNLVWGEEVLTLLCPPAGEEPHLALPELIQKVCNMYKCVRAYLSSNTICTCMQPPLHAFIVDLNDWVITAMFFRAVAYTLSSGIAETELRYPANCLNARSWPTQFHVDCVPYVRQQSSTDSICASDATYES